MQIVRVTNDETHQHIIHFDDGRRVCFLRPELNRGNPNWFVEPAASPQEDQRYIEAAFNWLSERVETANLPNDRWNEIMRRLQDLYDTWAKDHGSNTENVMQALDRLMDAYDKWLD